jgi:hypothetical protein
MSFDPVEDMKMALIAVLNHGVSLVASPAKKKVIDYKDQRADYYRTIVRNNLNKIKELAQNLDDETKKKALELESFFVRGDPKGMLGIIGTLTLPKEQYTTAKSAYDSLKLPSDIRDDVFFDLAEVERCFNAEAYRSVMILCARILETALHRKYYDATGKDLLETSPGIGLGNLISKLRESGIEIDPSLTQQVHLINNVRIFSVHKKSVPFQPSREQAQATLLFTIDILKKLF